MRSTRLLWTLPLVGLGLATGAWAGDVPDFASDLEHVPSGVVGYDGFGVSVDWLGDSTVVVGAPGDDTGGDEAGAVWILELDLGGGMPVVTSSERLFGNLSDAQFGESVVVVDGLVVVASPLEADRRGAVRVFADDGSWSSLHLETGDQPGARLGASLAGAGTTLMIGAPGGSSGGVLALDVSGGVVNETGFLTSSEEGDRFGVAVSVSEDGRVAVGAPGFADDRGRVSVFSSSAKGWRLVKTIDGLDTGDRFGEAVCFCGNRLAIGAPGSGPGDPGEVFLLDAGLELSDSQRLGSHGFETGGRLAYDSISGMLGVGCTGSNYAGGIRLHLPGNEARPLIDLVPPAPPEDFDFYGRGLALRNGVVLAGAPFRNGLSGPYAGACFVAGSGIDCDLDAIEDDWEVVSGVEIDCNVNGIPDACELGFTSSPRYERHDRISEKAEGTTGAGTLAWMERFQARPELEELSAIGITFGESGLSPIIIGRSVEVCIWADPDGDGTPNDATPISTINTTIEGPLGETAQIIDLPRPLAIEVGSNFFVGVLMTVPPDSGFNFWYPAAIDESGASEDSWIIRDPELISASDVSSADLVARLIDTDPKFETSRWMITAIPTLSSTTIDCNANGLIDSCEIAENPALDCNQNGSIDTCDLLDGVSEDRDRNEVPDECQKLVVLEVPAPYATINAALDVARDGDRVLVHPGTYAESIDFAVRAIEILSVDGPEVTVLDGAREAQSSIVTAVKGETSASILRGFTITNGEVGTPFPLDASVRVGGGLFAYFSSPTIENCRFVENNAAFGGGAYLYQWDGSMSGCMFVNNSAASDGGGLQLSRCDGVVESVGFSENVAVRRGGGLHVFNGSPILRLVQVVGNRANSEGGGVSFASFNGTPELIDSEVRENEADILGGGVFIDAATMDPEISGTVVCDNDPDDIFGTWVDLGGNTICFCEGDLDLNGEVSSSDLGLLLANWQNGSNFPQGDLSGDGEIGASDLGLLLSLFGPCTE